MTTGSGVALATQGLAKRYGSRVALDGLDPAGIVGMRDTLRALAAADKTVFVSSHILSEVQQLVDVVGIIARGRLVREGPVEALLREAGSIRVRVAPDEVARAVDAMRPAAGGAEVAAENGPEPGWIVARVDPARGAEVNRALATAGIYASRLETGTTLEGLFLELTGSHPDVGQAGDGPAAPSTPQAQPPATGWRS